MAMTPEKRSTSILRSTLLIAERLLASAQAVDESSAQVRAGVESLGATGEGRAVLDRRGADGA